MNKYIATFGSGQTNEGYYILINAHTYSDAVHYMERNYVKSYCMVYSLDQWIAWAEVAREHGIPVEKELMEVNCYDK